MRLLNVKTYQLEEFIGAERPPYAILSHTWGKDEVLFQDIIGAKSKEIRGIKKEGFLKIRLTCEQALRDNLNYTWVDTCCIDKTSSSELSEAINSMFAWYREADVCYAYLKDIQPSDHGNFRKSLWFTRGWTLQELIAPSRVVFYSRDWGVVGTRDSLCVDIALITRIDVQYLKQGDPQMASVAERMSWASNRVTTRPEDIAYCLLGIFDINMPLLYGEGDKAFLRLQEEIMRDSNDQSLFAWGRQPEPSKDHQEPALDHNYHGLLATSPVDFAHSSDIVPHVSMKSVFESTNNGIAVDAHLCDVTTTTTGGDATRYMMLNCRHRENYFHVFAIPIVEVSMGGHFARRDASPPIEVPQILQNGRQTHGLTLARDRRTLRPKYDLAGHVIFISGRLTQSVWKPGKNIISYRYSDSSSPDLTAYFHFTRQDGSEFLVKILYVLHYSRQDYQTVGTAETEREDAGRVHPPTCFELLLRDDTDGKREAPGSSGRPGSGGRGYQPGVSGFGGSRNHARVAVLLVFYKTWMWYFNVRRESVPLYLMAQETESN
ncbi:heterokaryon incompatibility protein-domain-containing protein [Xylariomycetidae sp. FL2044]|nr:heterokaryon incompatibility protein-domain-containing protein [Xylariomycetidae sp. FL2044]